jgi:hypothetical protein
LALFQRQAILKDYSLSGVGLLGSPVSDGSNLNHSGFGYIYPDYRTRFTYKTPKINGFDLEVGIFYPQKSIGNLNSDYPQLQAEANYKADFKSGTTHVWASFLWQEQDINLCSVNSAGVCVVNGNIDTTESFGWNVGLDVNMGGFNVMGSYYDGEALGTSFFNIGGAGDSDCSSTTCLESTNGGFILQGAYTFYGRTKLGVSFGESRETTATGIKTRNEQWTVGVYHDVNSWLKVIAEYGQADARAGLHGGPAAKEIDAISIGGFLVW